ncbi:MAG: hypothetical protein ACK2UY_06725 [Anaerolineae bacterium]|jgi:hypothetical protein
MTTTFEYRVCLVQQSRVTFADGAWAGKVPQDQDNVQAAFSSCPAVWAYLDQAGAEGWDLVAANSRAEPGGQGVEILYLKRQR